MFRKSNPFLILGCGFFSAASIRAAKLPGDDDGVVLHITLMLGGQLPEQAPVDMSEVWAVSDTGRQRRIAIRPVRNRKPCKTRMFTTTGSPEFDWKFDPEKWEGHMISTWWEEWLKGGKEKLPLPK